MRRKRDNLITLFILLVVLGIPTVRVYWLSQRERFDCALILAVRENDLRGVRDALKQGANPNTREHPEYYRTFWQAWLDQFRRKSKPIVTDYTPSALSIAIGTNVGFDNAVKTRHLDLIKALLDAGANVNASDSNGFTPLMASASNGNIDVVRLLISKGANVNARTVQGQTVLMSAREPAVLTALIDAGADVNARFGTAGIKEVDGSTALILTAYAGNLPSVQVLISRGATINAKNTNGLTALACAQNQKRQLSSDHTIIAPLQKWADVINFLRKAGAQE